MDSSRIDTQETPTRNKSSVFKRYEQLIEEYFSLAQDYATLETEQAKSEPREGVPQDELIKEMAEIRSELVELCEMFDEGDYKILFKREYK